MSTTYPDWDDAQDYTAGGEPDPFATPPYDPATGEILEPVPVRWNFASPPIGTAVVSPDGTASMTITDPDAAALLGHKIGPLSVEAVSPPATLVDLLPARLADDTSQAVALPGRGELAAFAGNLERALDDRVNALYGAALAARPDGPVSEAVVAPELVLLASVSDLGKRMAEVFTRMDKGARSLASDVVLEVKRPDPERPLERTGGSASVRVGARAGEDVKVTVTQPTETFTDTPGIVDVLAAHMVAEEFPEHDEGGPLVQDPDRLAAYARGARAMAAALLGLGDAPGLLASPKWKSTALDALRHDLERSAEPGLAGRLDAAYGRRPVGNLQTTVERLDPAKRGRARTIDGPA